MALDPREERRARVERVVAAGRRIADPTDPIGREARARLARSSGLSSEGIRLVLEEHLESRPRPPELARLVSLATPEERCHVLLAANVVTAALRAIACATASAPFVTVRASRRDPVLAELLVRELATDALFARSGGHIELVEQLESVVQPSDSVHAYGTDETLAALAARLPAGTRLLCHGTGLGIGVVDADASVALASEALALDVVPFDQQGCLSPRFVFVEGGALRAERLATTLHEQLSRAGARIPRGHLDDDARAALARARATAQALGPVWEGPHHLVALDPSPRAAWLAPACRFVLVLPCEPAAMQALLAPWLRFVTIVGVAGSGRATPGALSRCAFSLARHARRSTLGQMQHPPLDGPVDRRSLALDGCSSRAMGGLVDLPG